MKVIKLVYLMILLIKLVVDKCKWLIWTLSSPDHGASIKQVYIQLSKMRILLGVLLQQN